MSHCLYIYTHLNFRKSFLPTTPAMLLSHLSLILSLAITAYASPEARLERRDVVVHQNLSSATFVQQPLQEDGTKSRY